MREDKIYERVVKEYRPRVIDDRISSLLNSFGGLLIVGPKWCGKSWTGLHNSKSVFFVGDEESAALAILDPSAALEGEQPHLVDEWQDVPKLWDFARRNIDFCGKKGAYIFTGSTVPPLEKTSHSGTGRFAKIRMYSLSLFESGDSSGSISLSGLFNGDEVKNTRSAMDYRKVVDLMCRGGWPAAMNMDKEAALEIPHMYVNSVIDSDLYRLDGKDRDKNILKLILESLARNNATSAKVSVISEDISENGGKVSEGAIREYIAAFKKIYLVEEQKAWTTSLRSRARIRASPKRHITDPSLAAAILNATPDTLFRDVRTAGLLFESLCYRDLCVYATASKGNVYHYRDNTDLEIDDIIELGDGRWGAVEVKLGNSEFDKAAKNLLDMKEKVSNGREPSFLMVLCASGSLAYTRPDGVIVVPVDLLGP
jgi:predicted AAA+ superfamily ATPase